MKENEKMSNQYYIDRQNDFESSARSYPRKFPFALKKAKGSWVEDVEGNRYLDFLCGAGTLALGHNDDEVNKAMIDLISSDAPLHTLDLTTPVKDRFVQTILDNLPGELIGGGDDPGTDGFAELLESQRKNFQCRLCQQFGNRVEIPPVFRFGNDLAPDQRRRGTRFGNVLNPVAESTGIEQNENNDEHIENYCIPEGTPVTPVIFFQLKREITEFIAYAVVHSTASRYPATPLLSFRR